MKRFRKLKNYELVPTMRVFSDIFLKEANQKL